MDHIEWCKCARNTSKWDYHWKNQFHLFRLDCKRFEIGPTYFLCSEQMRLENIPIHSFGHFSLLLNTFMFSSLFKSIYFAELKAVLVRIKFISMTEKMILSHPRKLVSWPHGILRCSWNIGTMNIIKIILFLS